LKKLYPEDSKVVKVTAHDFCEKILDLPLIKLFIDTERIIW